MLAGRVRGMSRKAAKSCHRRDVDDDTATVRQHCRNLVSHTAPNAGEIDVDHAVPFVRGIFGGAHFSSANTRRIDCDIEPAKSGHRALYPRFDFFIAAHVHGNRDRAAALQFYLVHQRACRVELHIGNRHPRTLRRELQRRCAPEPRSTTGDECNLLIKF